METLASRYAAIMGARQCLAQGGVGAQRAAHRLCRHHNAGLACAARRKAEVFGADQHANAGWREGVVQCIGDLRGEALLHLQSSRKGINKAWDLREANDATARHVTDGGDTREREEVVFTEGVEWDSLNHDEVSSRCAHRLFEDGAENFVWVARVATGELEHGASNAAWGINETIARWVLADGTQNGLGRLGDSCLSIRGGHYGLLCLALCLHSLILTAPS
jgi:hypothetical protein